MNSNSTKPIIVERVFAVSPASLWRALTDVEEMKQWYFDLPEFRAEVGFKFSFTGGPSPERQYLHLCEVKEVVVEQKLSYSWRYEGYEGDSLVSFELIPQADKTLLRLSHIGLHTFPSNNPDLAKQNFETGWESIVNQSLAEYIGKLSS